MRHLIFQEADQYSVALLTKPAAFNRRELQEAYIEPWQQQGIGPDQIIAFTLATGPKGKVSAKLAREYLDKLLPALVSLGVRYLYVTDGEYFKVLTGARKADPHYGYVLPCKWEQYPDLQVVLGVNHKALFYNPELQVRLDLTLETLAQHYQGNYRPIGEDIIHHEAYPESLAEIRQQLNQLHQYPALTCDIETFSLVPDEAGIGTITFCWNQHEGIAFAVDYVPDPQATQAPYGYRQDNQPVKALLREFFKSYRGNLKFHRANFDIKVLIFELWMADGLDNEGLLQGLETLTRNFDDTKIVAYLALNSTSKGKYGLKELAQPFAGNWAQDEINNILAIPLPELLRYNLVDGLCTWYVYNTYQPRMVADQQEDLYHSLMLPSLIDIIQMELTGMPLDPQQVQEVKAELQAIVDTHTSTLRQSPLIQQVEEFLTQRAWERDFAERKAKAKNPDRIQPKDWDTFPRTQFNPNSGDHLIQLLYVKLQLPVIDLTESKQPATGSKTLKKLLNHTQDPHAIQVIEAIRSIGKAQKILEAFIPAFERAIDRGDGVRWLLGSYNLGGTVSGRLSSSDPNMQNLPSGSDYGKKVKTCFRAPKGWIFCGADFASLEDRINALLTRDPNKISVYTDGYDGHCLRAYAYYGHLMPDIIKTPESVNSIEEKYPELRQRSKSPTFALTYQGTWITLVQNLGFTEEEARQVEANYHQLYQVSDQWMQAQIDQAAQQGYAEVAFGLRIRTPILAQTLRGGRRTPYEAEAEARTIGNALGGQSYGLLTNRAMMAFMRKVRSSPYRNDIKAVAMIHDAIYLLIRDQLEVVEWVNRELIKEMEWQELPEIQHPQVKLGAELDLFYPTWAEPITLPNNIDIPTIQQVVAEELEKRESKRKEAA